MSRKATFLLSVQNINIEVYGHKEKDYERQLTQSHFIIDVNFSILKLLMETTEFFTNSPRHKTANIANFFLSEINKANEICKVET